MPAGAQGGVAGAARGAQERPIAILCFAVLLGLLAALPYVRGIGNSFITLDDDKYVTANQRVLEGLSGDAAGWALTTFDQANWHPLTWLSHMTDVTLFGLDARGHHLTNVLLHALNAALLFAALFRLTGSLWPSAFVAALFGVHPLHVESVAWVAERKDLLAGLFFMLVLLAYERYVRRGGMARYLGVVVFLGLGLTAKPMLVTAPFVLLLLDVWPLGRTALAAGAAGEGRAPVPWGRLVLEKAPLLALSGAASVVTFLAQREGQAVRDLVSIPAGARLANAVVSYASYLVKTVWPAGLAVFYPHPVSPPAFWKVFGSALLLAAVTSAVLFLFRRTPFLAMGWFWYLGMLVPVIGLVQVGNQAMADRYTYLPLLGVFVAAAWGIPLVVPARRHRALVLGASACAAIIVLSLATLVQVGYWKDSETLYRRALALTSGNWLIDNNLGLILSDGGRYEEAIGHLRRAVGIRPGSANVRNNLGLALLRQGRTDEAVIHLRMALRIRRDFPEAQNNLGIVLAARGETDEAALCFREALRLRPGMPEVHNNLGRALLAVGMTDEAILQFQEALRFRRDYPRAHYNLGNALLGKGRGDDALSHFREAVRLRPDYEEARNALAALLRRMEGRAGAGSGPDSTSGQAGARP